MEYEKRTHTLAEKIIGIGIVGLLAYGLIRWSTTTPRLT